MSQVIQSPCNRCCTLDEQDICVGCGRTLQEILDWSSLDAAARQQVVRCAGQRCAERERLRAERRGR